MKTNDEDEDKDSHSSFIAFHSFQSPINSKWWSFVRSIPDLKPVVETKDPHVVKITFRCEPPTREQLQSFPTEFVAGISCPTNRWLLVS
jgi:hypothetical protein